MCFHYHFFIVIAALVIQETQVLLFLHYFSCLNSCNLNSHVTLMGVDTVKQSFWRHPLDWKATLQEETRTSLNWIIIMIRQRAVHICWAHIGGLLIVVNVVDVTGQAKVGDLHHVVLRDQHIPGSQVSVDALQEKPEGVSWEEVAMRRLIIGWRNSPSWRPGTPSPWPPDRQPRPAPWAPCWPGRRAESHSSTPSQWAGAHGGTPWGCPVRRTPPPRTAGLRS